MDEAIPLVHLIASSLRVRKSLASAVRFAAGNLQGAARQELESVEWAVRIRRFSTIEEAFCAFAERAGRANPELKRALLTLQGAESESSREGLERRLDRAYDIIVRAEERRRERISATLERPVTTLFGMGVVLPLVVASLVPMLQMAAPAIGAAPLAVILLVALPLVMFVCAERIADRNQLGARIEKRYRRAVVTAALLPPTVGAAAWIPPALMGPGWPLPLAATVAIFVAATGAAGGISLFRRAHGHEQEMGSLAADLPDFLHAFGARVSAGRSAEQALMDAVEASKATPLAARLRGVLFDVIVGRRSLEQAVESDAAVRTADRVYPAMRLAALASARDASTAGQVVLHLAEFERLRHDAAESMRTRVRSIVDTARTTVVCFAPLILGITAGMFSLLTRISAASFLAGPAGEGSLSADTFAVIVAAYLAIQVALVDWFAARMLSGTPTTTLGSNLARDVPLAVGLFAGALAGATALF